MEVNDKVLFEIVAAEIVKHLDPEQSAGILRKGVAAALTGYEFKNAVEKIVAKRAEEKARAVIEAGVFDAEIDAAVAAEFIAWKAAFRPALRGALLELFGGRQQTNDWGRGPGTMLHHLTAARARLEDKK